MRHDPSAGVPVPDEPQEDAYVAEALERIRAGGMQEAPDPKTLGGRSG